MTTKTNNKMMKAADQAAGMKLNDEIRNLQRNYTDSERFFLKRLMEKHGRSFKPVIVSERDNTVIEGCTVLDVAEELKKTDGKDYILETIPANCQSVQDMKDLRIELALSQKSFHQYERCVFVINRYKAEVEAQAKENQRTNSGGRKPRSAKKSIATGDKIDTWTVLGKMVGISKETIRRVGCIESWIKDTNLDKIDADIRSKIEIDKQAIIAQKRSISEVYIFWKTEIDRLNNQAIIQEENNGIDDDQLPCKVYNSNFQDANEIADNSVDAIITDPPYIRKWVLEQDEDDEYVNLKGYAQFAYRVLKDGGSLVMMVGHYYLPTVINEMLKQGLIYHDILFYTYGKGPYKYDKHLHVEIMGKPILWFTKGTLNWDKSRKLIPTTIESSGKFKALYGWEQNPTDFKKLVELFTTEGETVCDPMLGVGTCAEVAIESQRNFVGCEVDKGRFMTSRGRIIRKAKELGKLKSKQKSGRRKVNVKASCVSPCAKTSKSA